MIAWLLPTALAGLTVAVLPGLIHLLTHRPAVRRAFPALRLLAAVHGGLARRSRLRDLLVLLLRTLALIALACALAGPLWRATTPAGAGTAVVVILDASLSMRQSDRGSTAWANGCEEARRILAAASPRPVLLIVAGTTLTQSTAKPVADAREALALLTISQAGFASADLPAALTRAAAALAEGGDCWLIGDGSRSMWSGVSPSALPAGVALHPVIVGAGGANLAVRALSIAPGEAVAGRPLRLTCEVANYSIETREVSVQITVGTQAATQRTRVSAGGIGLLSLDVMPPGPGLLRVAAQFTGAVVNDDALAEDDVRLGAIRVAAGLPVLVASDGDAGDARGALKPVLAALSAAGAAPQLCRSSDLEARLGGAALAAAGRSDAPRVAPVLITVGLAQMPEPRLLIAHLLAGGAWFAIVADVGDAALLAALPDVPAPILPGDAVEIPRRSRGLGVGSLAGDHPLLSGLRGREALLMGVEAYRYRPGRLSEGAVQLIAFADATPLLAERRVGSGRFLVFALSPSERDSSLAAAEALPLLLELVARVLLPQKRADCALATGSSLPADPPITALHDDGSQTPLKPWDGSVRVDRPGRYALGQGRTGSPASEIAVAGPAIESDLRQVAGPAGLDPAREGATRAESLAEAARGEPLWPWLLLLALACCAAESVLVRRP